MATNPKRLKLDDAEAQRQEDRAVVIVPLVAHPTPPTEFLSLNDDCLHEIFKKCPLNSLCTMNQVCDRLEEQTRAFFKRQCKEKVITIEGINYLRQLEIAQGHDYVKCFFNQITNISLGTGFQSADSVKRLIDKYMYVAEEDEEEFLKPKVFRLEGRGQGWRKCHGAALKHWIDHVESFTVSKVRVLGDLNDIILKYMPNLKTLTVCGSFDQPMTDKINWMAKNYPKLETFAWHTQEELPVEKLTRFMQANPQVKFISLRANRDTIQQLINTNVRIDRLYFTVSGNLGDVFDELHELCEQNVCQRLHLKIRDCYRNDLIHHMNQFSKQLGPYIEGLYFEKAPVDIILAKYIASFQQIKILQLVISGSAEILSRLPHLEELFAFYGVNQSNFRRYRNAMATYVEHTPSLKKIYMRNNSILFAAFRFEQLDSLRKSNVRANKLNIFFKTDETGASGALSKTECGFDKIEVSQVETEHVNNPLACEYLTTKALSKYHRR